MYGSALAVVLLAFAGLSGAEMSRVDARQP